LSGCHDSIELLAENDPDRILKRMGSDMVNGIGGVKIGFEAGETRIQSSPRVIVADMQ